MMLKRKISDRIHVYDRYLNQYWDETYTAEELQRLEKTNQNKVIRIRPNLFDVEDKLYPPNENDRVVFVNAEKPFFRRFSVGLAEKNKFSSVAESEYHRACKCGIAQASKFRLYLDGNNYLVNNKSAICEYVECLMGYHFETDCSIIVESKPEDCDQLYKILNGNELNLEIHHTCRISENKAMAYTACGKNILEFDVPLQYLQSRLNNKSFADMVEIFKDYYEDTEKHYIRGNFHRPIKEILAWEDFRASFVDDNENEIKVTVFKDRFSDVKYYNVGFSSDLGKKAYYRIGKKKIEDYNDAKRLANYIAYLHCSKTKLIDFA